VSLKKSPQKNHIVYHKDGSVWARGKMAKGVMEGYWEWFRKPQAGKKQGTIMRSGHFKNGKQTGVWTTYDKEGKIYKVTHIKN
jgi:antitoxin component YwqK of YwqJK toxin-antitoxin module